MKSKEELFKLSKGFNIWHHPLLDNEWRFNPLAVRQWDEIHDAKADKFYISVLPAPEGCLKLRPVSPEDGDDIVVTYNDFESGGMYILTNLNMQRPRDLSQPISHGVDISYNRKRTEELIKKL